MFIALLTSQLITWKLKMRMKVRKILSILKKYIVVPIYFFLGIFVKSET